MTDSNAPNVSAIKSQVESVEKYLNRDIDRINDSLAEVFKRQNDVEKNLEKLRGVWVAIGVGASVVGTLLSWGIQIVIALLKQNS